MSEPLPPGAIVKVEATYFADGRMDVHYRHVSPAAATWEVQRTALARLRQHLKRNILAGRARCPFAPRKETS